MSFAPFSCKVPPGVTYLTSLKERKKKCPDVHTIRQTQKGGDENRGGIPHICRGLLVITLIGGLLSLPSSPE